MPQIPGFRPHPSFVPERRPSRFFFQGHSLLGLDFGSVTAGCWIIGLPAALYVMVCGPAGGPIWCGGVSMILGGAVVMWLAFGVLGQADPAQLITTKVATSPATVDQLDGANAWERFQLPNSGVAATGGKLPMIRPASDPSIPWTALLIGLWIPNFFYWRLSQYIVQRTLGSKSPAEGQKSIVFAAALKLDIPFIVVIPGILYFNLFSGDLRDEAIRKDQSTDLINLEPSKGAKLVGISVALATLLLYALFW